MAREDLHAHLRDPQVHLRRVGEAAVTGVGTALFAPAKMSPALLRSLHGATGLIGAVGGAFALGEKATLPSRVALGGALGGLLLGTSVLGAAADTKTEQWLTRRGVKRPRWVMGAALGAFTLAMLWVEDLVEKSDEDEAFDAEQRDDEAGV